MNHTDLEQLVPAGMVLIPAGQFQMGSENDEAMNNEQPVHTVHLDAFYMDVYAVTNAQFKAFVDANPQWQKDNIDAWFHWGGYLNDWDGNNYPFFTPCSDRYRGDCSNRTLSS